MDPLSITAGAAGILSFGITICQSLVNYYGSWKAYPKDIDELCEYLERVSGIMRNLKMCIDDSTFPSASKEQVESSIRACSTHVAALYTKLEKLEAAMPATARKNAFKSVIQRAQYPFKESTLKGIKDCVACLEASLGVAIGALGIDCLGSLNSKTTALGTSLTTANQGINTISQSVQWLQRTSEQAHQAHQALPVIRENTVSLISSTHTAGKSLAMLEQQLQTYEPLLLLLPLIQENIETLPSRMASIINSTLKDSGSDEVPLDSGRPISADVVEKFRTFEQDIKRLQLQFITKPSLLQEELVGIDTIIESQYPASNGHARSGDTVEYHSKFKKTCVCRDVYKSSKSWSAMKAFQLTTKTLTAHRTGCPLFCKARQSQTNIIVVKAMCTSFLMKAVEVSVALTSGAGGFSLAPYLTLRTLCRDDSPAFKLFPEGYPLAYAAPRGLPGVFTAQMEDSLLKLKKLFQEGKASPYDINSEGENVFHLAVTCWRIAMFDCSLTNQQAIVRRNIFLGIAQLGVPVDVISTSPRRRFNFDTQSALVEILYEERLYQCEISEPISSLLLEFGSLSGPQDVFFNPRIRFQVIGDLPEYIDFYDCGALTSTVLARSTVALEKILNKYPESVNERNKLGQTALHLCAKWPWGTRRLLAAEAASDITDSWGFYPIDYACHFSDLESMKVLLAAGSPLCFLDASRTGMKLEERLKQSRFDIICDALVDRRTRLANLAKQILLPTDFANLVTSSPGLLDRNAEEVYRKIRDAGCSVPSALKVRDKHATVFHNPALESDEMESLYRAGFQNLDCPDKQQMTPLMLHAGIMQYSDANIIQWLISTGADPLKRVDDSGVGQMSYVALGMSRWAASTFSLLHGHGLSLYQQPITISDEVFSEFAPALELLAQNSLATGNHICRCLCSKSSCTPFSVFLQHTWWLVRVENFQRLSCVLGESRIEKVQRSEQCQSRWKDPRTQKDRVSIRLPTCIQAYRYTLAFFAEWILRTLHQEAEIPEASFDEIIRVFLFTELELTHTCCRLPERAYGHFSSRHEDEVCEIQDEEKELILEFESLCTKASRRRRTFPGSFCDFLVEFMNELDDRPRGRVGKEDAERIRDIGVVLDPDCTEV